METSRGVSDFPRWRRIRFAKEFKRVMKKGRTYHFGNLVLKAIERPEGGARLGISIRRTVCGAVGRSRVKRWIREAFRKNTLLRDLPLDVVVVVRKIEEGTGYSHIAKALDTLARAWGKKGCAGQFLPQ